MSDSESNTLPILPRSEPSTPCPTPSEDDARNSFSQEEMKVELRNRLTGETIDIGSKKEEAFATEIPQSMLNSLYVSNSSLEDNEEENKEIDFDVESETGDQNEEQDNDDNSTESDVESQSEDDENNDVNNEDNNEDKEEEEEEGEEGQGDPLDDLHNAKRYVVMDEGKPIVIIINNDKKNNETPGLLIFMMVLVCGLWLFNNTCKLCTLIDDKCLFRLP